MKGSGGEEEPEDSEKSEESEEEVGSGEEKEEEEVKVQQGYGDRERGGSWRDGAVDHQLYTSVAPCFCLSCRICDYNQCHTNSEYPILYMLLPKDDSSCSYQ